MHDRSRTAGPDRRSITAGLAAAGAAALAGPVRAAGGDIIVETSAGKVRGALAEGVVGFADVPYGAATAGRNRFMPPMKPTPWSGVREPRKLRVIAPQRNPKTPPPPPNSIFAIIQESGAEESEDCLRLDIWTPAADGAKRPVMVWLHGGGYASGSGSNPTYHGGRLARRGDVVVVNVTHRLNVFGHTYLGDLMGVDFATSGNAGILDIVAALGWVRENIDRFGGDPGKVMIFGESGGGGKVGTVLAMPAAKGLFHRAAIESGSVRTLSEKPEATRTAEALLAELGLKAGQAAELQAMPMARLIDAYFAVSARLGGGGMSNFSPVRDGVSVLRHPWDPVANPLVADVPVLIGTNQTETTLFQLGDAAAFSLDEAGLKERIVRAAGQAAGEGAVKLYRELYPQASPSDLWFMMSADRASGFRRGAIQIAELKTAQGGAPAFLYELLWKTPVMDGRLRSPHGLEISLVFNNPDAPTTAPLTGGGPRALAMAETVCDAWTAFARHGAPGTERHPWPAYDLERRTTMLLDEVSEARPDPFRATRMYWDSVANSFT